MEYKVEPGLFFEAEYAAEEAVITLNNAITDINNITKDLPDDFPYKSEIFSLQTSLQGLSGGGKIASLNSDIEATKSRLASLDSSFMKEYSTYAMEYLKTLDISGLSEEEIERKEKEYEFYSTNFERDLLKYLEDLVNSGNCSPEMLSAYEQQKKKVEIMEAQDELDDIDEKLLGTDPNSSEYKKLIEERKGAQEQVIFRNQEYLDIVEGDIRFQLLDENLTPEQRVILEAQLVSIGLQLDQGVIDYAKNNLTILKEGSKEYNNIFANVCELSKDMDVRLLNINHENQEIVKSNIKNAQTPEEKAYWEEQLALLEEEEKSIELDYSNNHWNKELIGVNPESDAYREMNQNFLAAQIDIIKSKSVLTEEDKETLEYLESSKYDIDKYLNDRKEWENMAWYNKLDQYTCIFAYSVLEGIVDVGENIVDGAVTLGGKAACAIQEFAGVGYEADKTREWVENFVSVDASSNYYDWCIDSMGLNSYASKGKVHSVGNFIGEMTGTIGLQFLPGGTAVMALAHGLKGVGNATEYALQSGVSFDDAASYGLLSGAIEAATSCLLYGKDINSTKLLDKFTDVLNEKTGYKIITGADKIISKLGPVVSDSSLVKKVVVNSLSEMPKIASKSVIAAGKEYMKEGASVFIDGEYNLDVATNKVGKAVGTQLFNELVVSPLTDKLTKKTRVERKKDINKTMKEKIQSNNSRIDTKQNQILSETAKDNGNKIEQMTSYYDVSKTNDSYIYISKLSSDIDSLTAINMKCNEIISHNQLNIYEKLVGSGFVNKFAKKVGSEVKGNVEDYIEKR